MLIFGITGWVLAFAATLLAVACRLDANQVSESKAWLERGRLRKRLAALEAAMGTAKAAIDEVSPRKSGVPSREQAYEILKARSLQLQSGDSLKRRADGSTWERK